LRTTAHLGRAGRAKFAARALHPLAAALATTPLLRPITFRPIALRTTAHLGRAGRAKFAARALHPLAAALATTPLLRPITFRPIALRTTAHLGRAGRAKLTARALHPLAAALATTALLRPITFRPIALMRTTAHLGRAGRAKLAARALHSLAAALATTALLRPITFLPIALMRTTAHLRRAGRAKLAARALHPLAAALATTPLLRPTAFRPIALRTTLHLRRARRTKVFVARRPGPTLIAKRPFRTHVLGAHRGTVVPCVTAIWRRAALRERRPTGKCRERYGRGSYQGESQYRHRYNSLFRERKGGNAADTPMSAASQCIVRQSCGDLVDAVLHEVHVIHAVPPVLPDGFDLLRDRRDLRFDRVVPDRLLRSAGCRFL
jgi:hypothetical protein